MSNKISLDTLYAIRLRAKGYPGRRLLDQNGEQAFLNFLIRALGENVFAISTRLGLDIYYLGADVHTAFIIDKFWLFQTQIQSNQRDVHITERKGSRVLDFFDNAVNTLSQHPQLFLSCCKKLIAKFNDSKTQTLLDQLLYSCFDEQLNRLIAEGRVPYVNKIKQLREKHEQAFLNKTGASTRLIKELTKRNALN